MHVNPSHEDPLGIHWLDIAFTGWILHSLVGYCRHCCWILHSLLLGPGIHYNWCLHSLLLGSGTTTFWLDIAFNCWGSFLLLELPTSALGVVVYRLLHSAVKLGSTRILHSASGWALSWLNCWDLQGSCIQHLVRVCPGGPTRSFLATLGWTLPSSSKICAWSLYRRKNPSLMVCTTQNSVPFWVGNFGNKKCLRTTLKS